MNTAISIGQKARISLLQMLRLTGEEEDCALSENSAPILTDGRAAIAGARQDLLEGMVSFILKHELEVNPQNVLRALSICNGSDQALARKVAEREVSGGTIDQAWLDCNTSSMDRAAIAEQAEMQRMLTKLEGSIEAFSLTAQTAHSAASDYRSELSKHTEALADGGNRDSILAELGQLARAMFERTVQIEQDMKRSELEASGLRQSLARAQRDAEIDHLTGLPNRRAFEGLFEAQYREAQREIEPLCVAFCDIDHFKQVNDTHGHETGDRVIQSVAAALARISDDKCHVARHGGEEFVMLFRGLNLISAREKLDEVREAMATRKFINRQNDEPIGAVTFSGGVADVFAFADPRAALGAADRALYRAKAGGRNRIEAA